jgi:hypothetical protein
MAIARCSRGALFTTKWVPMVSFTSLRLGRRRLQHCPVHHRWELVKKVDAQKLSDSEREEAARYPAGWLP